MWGDKKIEGAPTPSLRETPLPASAVREPVREVRAPEPPRESLVRGAGIATVGKNLIVKGTVSGSEDLYVDGEVEGAIELKENNITVGPNGKVNANLHARDIVVLGRVKGNVRAVERLEIRKTGSLIGDIVTARVVIEDGAYFKGSIDIQKSGPVAASPAPAPAAPAAAPAAPAAAPAVTAPAVTLAPLALTPTASPAPSASAATAPKF
jgi:cytoskeletal protein CcmA (bactofilin family)